MRVDSRDPGSPRGTLWDLDENRAIPKPVWFDTDPQLPNVPLGYWTFEAYQLDEDGRVKRDGQGDPLTYFGGGRLTFRIRPRRPSVSDLGPDEPLRFLGRQLERLLALEHRRASGVLSVVMLDQPCEFRGCRRVATHMVADEVESKPELSRGRLWSRGRMVDQHYYCQWHYQPPLVLDDRGEVVKGLEDAYRPQ